MTVSEFKKDIAGKNPKIAFVNFVNEEDWTPVGIRIHIKDIFVFDEFPERIVISNGCDMENMIDIREIRSIKPFDRQYEIDCGISDKKSERSTVTIEF